MCLGVWYGMHQSTTGKCVLEAQETLLLRKRELMVSIWTYVLYLSVWNWLSSIHHDSVWALDILSLSCICQLSLFWLLRAYYSSFWTDFYKHGVHVYWAYFCWWRSLYFLSSKHIIDFCFQGHGYSALDYLVAFGQHGNYIFYSWLNGTSYYGGTTWGNPVQKATFLWFTCCRTFFRWAGFTLSPRSIDFMLLCPVRKG